MPRGQWIRRSPNDRGLAEIVGTLMLVLIVVSAAVAFSFFVASYQAQLQAEETLHHNQALESLKILSVAPGKLNASEDFQTLSFTLVSEYINPSYVSEIQLNDQPIKNFTATSLNLTTGMFDIQDVVAGDYLNLSPQEQVTVQITFIPGPAYSFYVPYVLGTQQYVKIDAYTSLDNVFTRAFLPPTAIAVVTNTTSSSGTQTTLFDGTMSFQPEENATLVAWTWSIWSPVLGFTNLTGPSGLKGEEAQASGPLSPLFNPYSVSLLVTNSDGLTGLTNITYDA